MDHTAVIKLVETRFIGSGAALTADGDRMLQALKVAAN
jgi:hypothetical protein